MPFIADMSNFQRFLIIYLFTAGLSTGALAQQKKVENLPRFDNRRIHFGFSLGINETDFTIRRKAFIENDSLMVLESQKQKGFNLAIISDLHLHPFWSIRFIPGLSFGQRDLHYTFRQGDTTLVTEVKPVESTFIEFPLYLKYRSARVNNFAAYIIGGGKYAIDLASQSDVVHGDYVVKLRRNDIHAEIGFGLDLFLEYFKFSPEIKMSFGIPDVLVRDGTGYTTPVSRLSSRIFLLSFHFEG